jgi:hypothetical protein
MMGGDAAVAAEEDRALLAGKTRGTHAIGGVFKVEDDVLRNRC